ncbi:Rhs element Vgr family protein [Plesiocystis pacifica SIR-1]|uniref:Rhs element Vgr family protein n=1 Tax=Plesiocystis pacifica SIR-1 TaxID=391625 RepID=A6G240_9BACT|nr:type VI secretion system tip protein TssI/VgrG [Plesiocystis pacifica]EDM80009.1 Rhs element Vgr family protein [Plesiocystis pacifica SIR-1]
MAALPPLTHRIAFPDGPTMDWEVERLRIHEGLNQCGEAVFDLRTQELQSSTRELLGARCELSLQRGDHPPQSLFGVVTRVEQLGLAKGARGVRVRVEPAVALARQRVHSRIFQGQSVLDIVREVLAPILDGYARAIDLDGLRRGAAPRDYCVQYRERDLEFVRRLLEEEGINWFFVHDPERGCEVLTLSDDNKLHPRVENVDGSDHIALRRADEGSPTESFGALEWREALTPTATLATAYDPGSPGSTLGEGWAEPGTDARGHERRVYVHDIERLGNRCLDQRARDLGLALALDGSRLVATGDAAIARPGHRFVLDGAEDLEDQGAPSEWIVLAATQRSEPDAGGARVHGVEVECVPADAELRPMPSAERPIVAGPQTATVVGGGEIDVDAEGRIQVQMHWQEGAAFSPGASCRVRCAQSWAGGSWGAQFIPRVGMEVVVEFLEGNPDRPLVTGCVYNGGAAPPFSLPGSATQSGWRSHSSPGGGGFNELRFEDAAGLEELYIHAQRDWNTEVLRHRVLRVGSDSIMGVGGQRSAKVDEDERLLVGGSRSVQVANNQAITVGADASLTVGGSQSVTVAQDRGLSVGGSHTETVAVAATETVGAAKTVTVGGALMTIVGAAMNTSVGGLSAEEVGGMKSVSVAGGSSEAVVGPKSVDAASISHSARADLGQSAGANYSLSAGADLSMLAEGQLSLNGKKKGLIELEDTLTIKVGKASLSLQKNGTITLRGVKLSVEGKKSITLKAKKINQN